MFLKDRLKELRKDKNITQKELSKELNLAYTTYNGYEIGKIIPPIDKVELLSEYFDVTIDYLVGKTDLKISPSELAFVHDIDLENEELMKKYNLLVGDQPIEPEALAHWIAILKINLKKRD